MSGSANIVLPRDTTRQAESALTGNIARLLHRATGVIIVAFVLVHVIVQSVIHVPVFEPMRQRLVWLPTLVTQNWIHAILLFAVVYHTLYGFKLVAAELGWVIGYRRAFHFIFLVSVIAGLREIARYAGI